MTDTHADPAIDTRSPRRARAGGPRLALRLAADLWWVLRRYPSALVSAALILVFIAAALLAPVLAPWGPFEVAYGPGRTIRRLAPPDLTNLLGTTNQGMDVFSQLLWGARVSLAVGLLSALGSVVIGTLIGLLAGYCGGWIDEIAMRATDVAFGMPFLPFAMVVITIATPSLGLIILLVIFFLWRTTARVIRAQVLSLRTRPFIWAARAAGASDFKILVRHVAPNVLPLSFLYVAIGVQTGVMLEAALSFLGFGDPKSLSWGTMLNDAFRTGAMRTAWWWVLPPGLSLSILVMAVFMVSRAYEEILNPRLRSL
jgi:peptide/nickel transport system permease protein